MYEGQIEFSLRDLCKMCIHQMVLLASSRDAASSSAVRLFAHDTARDLRIIEREVQAAIAHLTKGGEEGV